MRQGQEKSKHILVSPTKPSNLVLEDKVETCRMGQVKFAEASFQRTPRDSQTSNSNYPFLVD